jgi:excisionase family DNA binding protein
MNLADAIRQATQKAPMQEHAVPDFELAAEAVLHKLAEVDDVVIEEPTALPPVPAPQVFGGNVVRLELFLAPEQLNALFRAALANHHTMMTSREAAAYLRIHIHTLEQMAQDGKLPALQIDGKWRFLKSSIDEWVTLQRYQPEPEETSHAA